MTQPDGFDRIVSDWLDRQAGDGAPDYLDETLAKTIRTRQRPEWSSLGTWLPVLTTPRFARAPRIAWLLVVVALLAALGVAAVAIGSRHRQPAPPFGLARNGVILYSGTDNDIHALDPTTGVTMSVLGGPSSDHAPWLSPDGTRFFFLRDTTVTDPVLGGFEPMIMLADVDGRDARPLSGPLAKFDNAAWSRDGSRVVVASNVGSAPSLQILTVDGSSKPIVIDTGGMTALNASFRPGDREITFRGSTPAGDGLYAVGADGHGLRLIAPLGGGRGASLSPDGTKLAYVDWDGIYGVIHVTDVDTGHDAIPVFPVDTPSKDRFDDLPRWSPDGTRLVFMRYDRRLDPFNASYHDLAVAPSTGGPVVEIGRPTTSEDGSTDDAQFSPDGTEVIAHYSEDGSTWILDATGKTSDRLMLSSTIDGMTSWQRLAP